MRSGGTAQCVALDYLASKNLSPDDFVVVSPDVGGVARARAFAKKVPTPLLSPY